jgi:hypothetical protein
VILAYVEALQKLGRHRDAEPVCRDAYESYRSALGKESVGILRKLVAIYEALEDEQAVTLLPALLFVSTSAAGLARVSPHSRIAVTFSRMVTDRGTVSSMARAMSSGNRSRPAWNASYSPAITAWRVCPGSTHLPPESLGL